jgi:hypothetical protein
MRISLDDESRTHASGPPTISAPGSNHRKVILNLIPLLIRQGPWHSSLFSTRSCVLPGIPCFQSYRASLDITKTLLSGRYKSHFPPSPPRSPEFRVVLPTSSKDMTQLPHRLTPMIPSSNLFNKSTCGAMPSPGRYRFRIACRARGGAPLDGKRWSWRSLGIQGCNNADSRWRSWIKIDGRPLPILASISSSSPSRAVVVRPNNMIWLTSLSSKYRSIHSCAICVASSGGMKTGGTNSPGMGGGLRIARGIDLVEGSSKSESTLSESEFESEARDLLELGVRKDMAHCNDRCERSSLGEHALTFCVTGTRSP